jgi:hypothetical protein
VAAHVGLDLGAAQALLRQRPGVFQVDEGMVVIVDHDFQRHVEQPCVVQRGLVVERDAPGTVVDVMAFVEAAVLGLAAQFLQLETLARRLAAPTGEGARFQHFYPVAEFAQFEGRGHAGQAGTEDQHLLALAAAAQGRRRCHLRCNAHAPGIHGVKEERRAADGGSAIQEITSGQRRGKTFHPHLYESL